MQNNTVIKGPRGAINQTTALDVLRSFSDETVYTATLDIIFSLDLKNKDVYTSFIQQLFKLIKEPGVKTRLEQSLLEQIRVLQKRKVSVKKSSDYDIEEILSKGDAILNNLSNDLKLQLDITNYILMFYKRGEFLIVEKMLDVLIEKSVLLNTVKNFIKKELDYYIAEQDIENLKRLAAKYSKHHDLGLLIKEELDRYIERRKV